MHRKLVSALIVLVLTLQLHAETPAITAERLGTLPAQALALKYSERGCRCAVVAVKDGKQVVVLDGVAGALYDSVQQTTPIFSADGQHLAYGAEKATNKWVMVRDGIESPEYEVFNIPVFSADGKHLACSGRKGNQWFMLVDGIPGAGFEALTLPQFSPDGTRVAYVIHKGEKNALVVDGQVGPEYDSIDSKCVVFSPDSKHVAYLADVGKTSLIVIDGKPGKAYVGVFNGYPKFSPDSQHVFYVAKKISGASVAVIDENEGAEGDKVSHQAFSADGAHLAYLYQRGKNGVVTRDGKPVGAYDGIAPVAPTFSPDGQHCAYVAQTGGVWSVYVDGKATATVEGAANLTFSPNSKRFAYVEFAGNRKFKLVVDGKSSELYDGVAKGSPFFSPDSQHLGCVAKSKDKWSLTVDGQSDTPYDGIGATYSFSPDSARVGYCARKGEKWVEGDGEYDEVGAGFPIFSADGKHLIHRVRKGKKWLVLIDGKAGAEWDFVFDNGPVFGADGALVYEAVRGGELWRVRCGLGK